MKTDYLKFDPNQTSLDAFLAPVVQALNEGKPVALPTETVYGVASLMLSKRGVESLFDLKGRRRDKPMAVLVSTLAQVELLCIDIPPLFYKLAKIFLPGPLTLILKAKQGLSPLLTLKGSIAIRLSSNRVAARLVELAGAPLTLTSANLSGQGSLSDGLSVYQALKGRIETVIDDGQSHHGLESTILSLVDPERPMLIREGVVSRGDLELVIGKTLTIHNDSCH